MFALDSHRAAVALVVVFPGVLAVILSSAGAASCSLHLLIKSESGNSLSLLPPSC